MYNFAGALETYSWFPALLDGLAEIIPTLVDGDKETLCRMVRERGGETEWD